MTNELKTIFIPNRGTVCLFLVWGCLSVLCCGGMFCFIPEARSGFFAYGFLDALIWTGLFGWMAFFVPRDWFQSNAERKARWWNSHPYLRGTVNILTFGIFACYIINDILHHFPKH